MEPFVLAAARTDVIVWGAIIGAGAVVAGIIVMAIRSRVLAKDAEAAAPGFTLEELRKLRDSGELSEQEYEIARNRMAMAVKKMTLSSPKSEKDLKIAKKIRDTESGDPFNGISL